MFFFFIKVVAICDYKIIFDSPSLFADHTRQEKQTPQWLSALPSGPRVVNGNKLLAVPVGYLVFISSSSTDMYSYRAGDDSARGSSYSFPVPRPQSRSRSYYPGDRLPTTSGRVFSLLGRIHRVRLRPCSKTVDDPGIYVVR
jgi:hypothetical protein